MDNFITDTHNEKDDQFKEKYGLDAMHLAFGGEEKLIHWFDNNGFSFSKMLKA